MQYIVWLQIYWLQTNILFPLLFVELKPNVEIWYDRTGIDSSTFQKLVFEESSSKLTSCLFVLLEQHFYWSSIS